METERRLIARVGKGDEAAFAELAGRYGGRLLAVAGRLLGSRADAEDAVQRALLQCFANAARYRPKWAVSTWLYRILTNICVDELRRRSTRAAADRTLPATMPSADGPPGAYVDLQRALERVPRVARGAGEARSPAMTTRDVRDRLDDLLSDDFRPETTPADLAARVARSTREANADPAELA